MAHHAVLLVERRGEFRDGHPDRTTRAFPVLVGLARAEKKPNTTRLAFKLILVFENRASYMWLLSQKVTQYIITKDYSEFSLNIRIMKLLYAINGFCS